MLEFAELNGIYGGGIVGFICMFVGLAWGIASSRKRGGRSRDPD